MLYEIINVSRSVHLAYFYSSKCGFCGWIRSWLIISVCLTLFIASVTSFSVMPLHDRIPIQPCTCSMFSVYLTYISVVLHAFCNFQQSALRDPPLHIYCPLRFAFSPPSPSSLLNYFSSSSIHLNPTFKFACIMLLTVSVLDLFACLSNQFLWFETKAMSARQNNGGLESQNQWADIELSWEAHIHKWQLKYRRI